MIFISPVFREIDLLKQKRVNRGGLNGTIGGDIHRLEDLSALNLASNSLSGEIPASTPNLAKLKVLNLLVQNANKQITLELGRLQGMCFV